MQLGLYAEGDVTINDDQFDAVVCAITAWARTAKTKQLGYEVSTDSSWPLGYMLLKKMPIKPKIQIIVDEWDTSPRVPRRC